MPDERARSTPAVVASSVAQRAGPVLNSTRRRPTRAVQLPWLLVLLLLVASSLLPSVAAAVKVTRPAHGKSVRRHGPLAARVVAAGSRAASASYGLSPRPTPSSPTAPSLPDLIRSYRTKPLPKLAYVRGQTIRRAPDLDRRATDEATCLAEGTTAAQINALFASKGKAAGVLDLCPSTVYFLEETIYFTAAGQGLQTLGGSKVARTARAELRVASANISTAVNAMNCAFCNDLYVADVLVNGSRSAFGSLENGEALLEMGGTSQNHTVQRTKLFDTRGWSSLHFIEGYNLVCSGATVVDNEIGPSGQTYTEGKIADGISLSCADSFIARNTIFDATDGAIVVFSSPSSLIVNNTITAANALTLGAVNMVDYAPWAGNYSGTRVLNNKIVADGNSFKIGIAIGPAIWGDDVVDMNFGGVVVDNHFSGPDLMFGVAVSGVSDFTIQNNTADSTARFGGMSTGNCHGISSKVEPTFALYDRDKTRDVDYGSDANCWSAGVFQYLLCYDPPTSAGTAVAPAFLEGGSGCSADTPSPIQPAVWNNTGLCFEDSNTRILDGSFIQTVDNSIAFCLDRCATLDYTWAGLENSDQCWCGNTIHRGDGYGVVRPPSACDLPCVANSSDLHCGGSNYGLSLWQDLTQVSEPYDAFAGTAWTDSGYCLTDSSERILVGWHDGDGFMTPQFCQSQCSILGFPLAGLENSGECYCSSAVRIGDSYGALKPMSDCDSPCLGDDTQVCGGDNWSLHLFYDAAQLEKPVYPFDNLTAVSTSSTAPSSSAPSSSSSSPSPSSAIASLSSASSSTSSIFSALPSSSSAASASASSLATASVRASSTSTSSSAPATSASTATTSALAPSASVRLSPAQASRRSAASASQQSATSSSGRLIARATTFL